MIIRHLKIQQPQEFNPAAAFLFSEQLRSVLNLARKKFKITGYQIVPVTVKTETPGVTLQRPVVAF